MRLKDLFSVPKEKGITDKYLCRVLACSICGILLCMGCLAGTTWAWFAVSIENVENVIEIGEPTVNVTVDGKAAESGIPLSGDPHVVTIEHGSEKDSLSKRPTLYVTLTIGEVTAPDTQIIRENVDQQQTGGGDTEDTTEGTTEETPANGDNGTQQQTGKVTTAYVVLSDENDFWTVTIAPGRSVCLFWEVSWDKPENIPELSDSIEMIEDISAQKPDSGMEIVVEPDTQIGGAGDPVESDPPDGETENNRNPDPSDGEQGSGEESETPDGETETDKESETPDGETETDKESETPDGETEPDEEPETQGGESGAGEEPTGSTEEVTNENVA